MEGTSLLAKTPVVLNWNNRAKVFSVAVFCEFAVKHCNQRLTFSRRLDTGFAHDIGCGQRLAVQAVVRVIVWFHCCASQGYASKQSLGLPVGQDLGVRCTGRSGAGARRCRRIRAHLGLSVQNLIYNFRSHEQQDEISGRAAYLETSAHTADRRHRRRGPLAVEVLATAAEQRAAATAAPDTETELLYVG